jgi:tetratricopeptide (TPR) repeat protein
LGNTTTEINELRASARRCEASNDGAGAVRNWSALISLLDDAEARERLGVWAIRRGEFELAHQHLVRAVELAPSRAKSRVLLARAIDEIGSLEEAFEAWRSAAEIEQTAETHTRMGMIAAELGRDEEAIGWLEAAWTVEPLKIKPLRALASIRERRGEFEEASELWRRVLASEHCREGLANIGRLAFGAGDLEKALACFEQVLAGGEDSQILHKIAAIHERAGAIEKAEEALRRSIIHRDEALSRDRLGVLLRDQGRIDDAINEFQAAAAIEPNVRRYWLQIARLSQLAGYLDKAADAWRNVIAFAPDEDAYQKLAVLLLRLNRPKEAVELLTNAAAISGETADSWRRLASALEEADESRAAMDAWRRALELAPDDTVAKRRLSQLYFNEDLDQDGHVGGGVENDGTASRADRRGRVLALFRGNAGFATPQTRSGDGRSAVLELVNKELGALSSSDAPIVVGPWLSEFGFELLYWIPFLKWAVRRAQIAPERIIVASRGGMRPLYETLGSAIRYVDIFDALSADGFRELNERRWLDTGLQKHLTFSDVDKALLQKLGVDGGARVLHPRLMYMLFASFWSGRSGFRRYRSHVELTRMRPIDHPILKTLPETYVAAKFYSRPSFRNSAENSQRLQRFVRQLAQKAPVVILNTGLSPDEHGEFVFEPGENIYFLNQSLPASENLHAQAAIVSHAQHLYCTYGGFAYLPLFFGGASTSYYSGDRHYLHVHSPAAFWMAEKVGARLSVVEADALNG